MTTAIKTTMNQFVCNISIKLPILSKDGQEFGGLLNNSSTSIFKFGDNYKCEVVENLGIRTGKISFSYEGRYIAFHT
jgi:hypothetical protein